MGRLSLDIEVHTAEIKITLVAPWIMMQ